jgi:hypothetical protein
MAQLLLTKIVALSAPTVDNVARTRLTALSNERKCNPFLTFRKSSLIDSKVFVEKTDMQNAKGLSPTDT